jgi:hypothetical protein
MRRPVTRTLAAATLLGVAIGAAARERVAYDFTGRWEGAIVARGETFQASANLASSPNARRFAGHAVVVGSTGPIPCGLRGKRARRVRIFFSCEDGTRGRLVGALDVASDELAGVAKLRDRRGTRARGEFALAKQGG